MKRWLLLALPLALGCASTRVAHHTLSSSRGTVTEAGFGTGSSSINESSLGRSSSVTDVRVEHAADVTQDGAVPRFWRVTYVDADRESLLRAQHVELCYGLPSAPGACARAKAGPEGKETEVTGLFPTLLEAGNLGASLRAQSGSSTLAVVSGTSVSTVQLSYATADQGTLRNPVPHRATPAFGVWMLTAPVGIDTGIYGLGGLMRTGALNFCHAPSGKGPRCYPAGAGVAKVLSVHVLRRGASIRHVVWGQAVENGTWSEKLVRCEADDEQAAPTCVTTEVPK
jgi:hypothetical protein